MEKAEDIPSDVFKKPSLFWLATEGQRALLEFGRSFPYRMLRKSSSGDGHPVLVLPGFMASDFSTSPLRSFIDKMGYQSHPWGIGRNYGNQQYLDVLTEKLEQIFLTSRRRTSIIGWSLGGVYAREIAKRRPKLTRQIITLGSPFAGLTQPNHARWIYDIITGGKGTDDLDEDLLTNLTQPAPVPTTAIFSKEDGVVPWEACCEITESNIHQNIQVRGSHIGLGVNPVVLEIIADRLQYSKENWSRYE